MLGLGEDYGLTAVGGGTCLLGSDLTSFSLVSTPYRTDQQAHTLTRTLQLHLPLTLLCFLYYLTL